ncbi:MAG: hypothetical protein OZ921_11985 [Sorangiineae bacterium]|nr:hypothetical protein [Polyangiaceae bacterium]MEB2323225.1 hypothetical protein [Sorangiineae bacterium]
MASERTAAPASLADSRVLVRARWLATVVVLFGVVTIIAGGAVLSGQVDGGKVVPFVLWFNFLAGFFYVAAGVAIARLSRWAPRLAGLLAGATTALAVAFAAHVARGGAFEPRTALALAVRAGAWAVIAYASARLVAAGRASAERRLGKRVAGGQARPR